MALIKQFQTTDGFVCNYIRVVNPQISISKDSILFRLEFFQSKESKDAGMKPCKVNCVVPPSPFDLNSELNPYKQVYAYLHTLPQFEGAEDDVQ